ncbi:SUMF1/EgtB/PvdO family nonheme iron enzyme [Mesobacillus foraminis]|uniref:SUMF1/EgtB/PvdO family nonheme iron enzyme n=1 Tax=Mesobacillus foraminis TaxID=279826 RepID=UPI000EF5167F|nr:SUMF1/EgtB/PvdO family nonheme iron enzyme [Mesobacillus foraminis]
MESTTVILEKAADQLLRAEDRKEDMVLIEGGEFLMGTDDKEGFSADGEGPIRNLKVNSFLMDRFAESNKKFLEFVSATIIRRCRKIWAPDNLLSAFLILKVFHPIWLKFLPHWQNLNTFIVYIRYL